MPKQKILLIEDEITYAAGIEDQLNRAGYQALSTPDGAKGWELVQSELPNLIILDLMLPRLGGLDICRLVRRTPETETIPIIILTAKGTETDTIIGLEIGADDYIVKPAALGEVLARVGAVLRRAGRKNPKRVSGSELESADLKVNLHGRRVYKDGDEIRLSNKMFDLLAELLRNRGVVMSRDLLLTKVWGYDYFVDKRTVDVHIRWLREKIEEDASDPRRIITVRGIGYKLEW